MAQFNITHIQTLLQNGDREGAENALADFFASAVTPEEAGKAYADLALAYVEAENFFNGEYLAFLSNALETVKELQRQGGSLLEEIDLSDIRKKIEGS